MGRHHLLTGIYVIFITGGCTHQSSEQALPYGMDTSHLEGITNVTAEELTQQKSSSNSRFTYRNETARLETEISYFNNSIDSYIHQVWQDTTLTSRTRYNHPGTDGIWQTADDSVFLYEDHLPQDNTLNKITYDNPGPDQLWFTADDRIRYYEHTQVDTTNNTVHTITTSLIGPDNIWFTADDATGWVVSEIQISTTEKHIAVSINPGPDGDWFTIDDNTVFEHANKLYNANGLLIRYVLYRDTGPDSIPFTPDDPVILYNDYSYDNLDRPLLSTRYTGEAGLDNILFTPDDPVNSCKEQQRDVNDLPIRTVTWRPGPDLLCLTADDIVWGYHDDSFDINNQLQSSHAYYGSGLDNNWFTNDDIIVSIRNYLP